ncbi:outer membrane lipoprotein carrier protein LolA [uncultured Sutterella sp.]|uniref:outer membrane lipoprotein carrier protein LolA n=1 Tax=uncultured Sutterella sp. TaxID=286133 RepID=UPI0025EF5B6C|nr:outer membrane lipoprotein carrier protein LolA [uncultured Sutterella sp.]
MLHASQPGASRRSLLCGAAALAAALSLGLPSGRVRAAEAPDGRTLLEKFLSGVACASGAFEQETITREGRRTGAASGEFAFLRPSKFDWQYLKPYRQRIVGDGEMVRIYDEDLMQVTEKKMTDAVAATPAAVLFGAGRIPADWVVVAEPGVVSLTPREAAGGFERIEVAFDASGLPNALGLVDAFGQATRIRFTRFTPGTPAPERFVLRVPEGVDVMRDAQ